jgi:aspartate 1-decarboxylase
MLSKVCADREIAAARKVVVGDVVIIMSFGMLDFEEAKKYQPVIIFPDTKTNKLI